MARTGRGLFLAGLLISAISLNCGSESIDGPVAPAGGNANVKGPGGGTPSGLTPGSPNPDAGPSYEGPPLVVDASVQQDAGPGATVAEAGTKQDAGTTTTTTDSGTGTTDSGTGDPCATVVCNANEVCVPYAHNQPFGVCVPTCDCSNCGNCGGDNADGRWTDQQEYCGNRGAMPATETCTRPCESGGCIPWGSTGICWPMEGCFSK